MRSSKQKTALALRSPKVAPREMRATNSEPLYAWSPSPSSQTLSLPEQIAEQIGNAIIAGTHAPGARIQEQDIADRFNVSRGPVREALRILERDGLVEIHARRGAQVTRLSVDDVNHLFEVRISMIGLSARLFAEQCDPGLLERFRAGVDRLIELAKSGDADGYINAVYRNNLLLAEGSGNRFLRNMTFALAHRTLRYTRLGLSTASRRVQSARRWRDLLAAVQGGNPKGAQQVAESLARASRDTAVKVLKREQMD